MSLIIAIAIAAVLLGGFVILTVLEGRKGGRVLAPMRARLDYYVAKATGFIRATDLHALAHGKMSAFLIHLGHEVAHGILVGVRALEHALTRVVRTLRRKKEGAGAEPEVQDTTASVG